ncbi:MAG: hypothetical protein N4A33_03600 [Bacteriovoracaceae bacterium]|jgi:ribosomal protein L21|nr:hypothetical protein [Bacteriovoracaceae bacterium]
MKTLLITILLTSSLYSSNKVIDKKDYNKENDVHLISGMDGDYRFYIGKKEAILKSNLQEILASILNYTEKCNNEYSDRRLFTPKSKKCLYHNSNLIESKVHILNNKMFAQKYLVERRIYNSGLYTHVDLIQVSKTDSENIKVTQTMLSNKEASQLKKGLVENNSVFNKAIATFNIKKLETNKYKVKYEYSNKTDHWLLTKSFTASRVFNSVSSGLGLLFTALKEQVETSQKKI